MEAEPERFEKLFDRVGKLSAAPGGPSKPGRRTALGPLMDENHSLLQQLTVSCPELDRLVAAARKAGALGAKLSGGGRGGNMIALVEAESEESVSRALLHAGAKRVLTTTVI